MPVSAGSMPDPEKLAALISEYRRLDRLRDALRIRQILTEAAQVVDRQAEPKKWAALRSMFAQMSESDNPEAAVAAYQDTLTVWQPEADRDSWVQCHSGIGLILAKLHPPGSTGADEAIAHIELVIADQPVLAYTLAFLYRYRCTGDPAENWERRVKYLELALQQVSCDQEPGNWAAIKNEIGLAYAQQPDPSYSELPDAEPVPDSCPDPTVEAVEKRIRCHEEALAALGQAQNAGWIETCLHLSESYLFRVAGERHENLYRAEEYSRKALSACAVVNNADLTRQALLSVGRVLSNGEGPEQAAGLHEALTHFEQASRLIDPRLKPELFANVEALRTSVYLQLMRLGEPKWLEPLITSSEAALRGFDPQIHLNERRSVFQVQGEALLEAEEFLRATGSFESAVQLGEAALAQSTTNAGRMERIFQLRDSSALLSYCYLKLGQPQKALEVLDRGKTRLWNSGAQPNCLEALPDCIPQAGALLFPVFSGRWGAVVVVSREREAARSEVVWLQKFGNLRLMELQRGDSAAGKLGGWLNAYCLRKTQPENWRREIDAIGGILHEEVWSPVLVKLKELGIARGAELVWFPQGGSGVFPMHAAWQAEAGQRRWLIEDYALRYAPSVQALLAGSKRAVLPGTTVIVSNPMGDLVYSDLECVCIQRSLAPQQVEILRGDAATKEAVMAALNGCSLAHFATHAMFESLKPFQSCIWMAKGEPLTLGELLPYLQKQSPSFVVLSACETGITRVTATPDEFLGFPAAFLEHGTRTVVSSLWAVDDLSTALLMDEFYRRHVVEAQQPAYALRGAQLWLRDGTADELHLADTYQRMYLASGRADKDAYESMRHYRANPKAKSPFEHPYYWAGFTCSGV